MFPEGKLEYRKGGNRREEKRDKEEALLRNIDIALGVARRRLPGCAPTPASLVWPSDADESLLKSELATPGIRRRERKNGMRCDDAVVVSCCYLSFLAAAHPTRHERVIELLLPGLQRPLSSTPLGFASVFSTAPTARLYVSSASQRRFLFSRVPVSLEYPDLYTHQGVTPDTFSPPSLRPTKP